MKKASVWFLLSLASSLSSAKKQRECHAPATYSQDDINILSQGLLQLGMELKMQVSNSKNHTGHLFKQLDTLNTSVAELLTQVSRQERRGEDLERRAEQLGRRSAGLHQLVAELQRQLVVGTQGREKLRERLELLERTVGQAGLLLGADGPSRAQVRDAIMPSVQRENQTTDELFGEVKMQQKQSHKRDTLIKKLREKVKSKPKPTKESVKTGNKKSPTHP